jgi:aminocarboxymuconate-semialdehyde decarboxylase
MIDGIFVIDMQHHFIPSEALKFVGKTPEYDYTIGLRRYRKSYEIMVDINEHLKFMDEAGIDMSILSTGAFTPNGYNFCKACNDGYSKVVKQYPNRFKGMIHVYPYDQDKNENEIKRGVEELGLWGIALASSYGEMTVDSSLMDPIYKMAMKYDMPVFVHPTIRVNLWGGERYDLYTTVSREYDIAKSFVEMLYGVLPRFPGLKVIMAHFGGGLPALKGRLLAWHQPKDFPIPEENRGHGISIDEADELGLVNDFESRLKNIIFDSAGYGGWLPVIKSAFETLGPDHICFGTDYPYELSKPQYTRKIVTDIIHLPVPIEDKRKFFSENLKRFFVI